MTPIRYIVSLAPDVVGAVHDSEHLLDALRDARAAKDLGYEGKVFAVDLDGDMAEVQVGSAKPSAAKLAKSPFDGKPE